MREDKLEAQKEATEAATVVDVLLSCKSEEIMYHVALVYCNLYVIWIHSAGHMPTKNHCPFVCMKLETNGRLFESPVVCALGRRFLVCGTYLGNGLLSALF